MLGRWVLMIVGSLVFICGKAEGFEVMTYNMHGIPCIKESYNELLNNLSINRCPDNTYWSRTHKERFVHLTTILRQMDEMDELPDVLLLQEAFYSKIRYVDNSPLNHLLQNSPYRYYVTGPGARVHFLSGAALSYLFQIPGIVSSGLVILSKYPIKRGVSKAFFKCRDTDCIANKGILYAQIQKGDLLVDVFNTHYQAGQRFENVKLKQNNDSAAFVQKIRNQSRARVQIYAGDFNFRNQQNFPSFQDFVEKTKMSHVGQLCDELGEGRCQVARGTKPEWVQGSLLDHQFVSRTNENISIYPSGFEYGQYKWRGRALTDHPFLKVKYEIREL